MATLVPNVNAVGGSVTDLDLTAAAAGGDQFTNPRGRGQILVLNSHATLARTITVAAVQTTRPASAGAPATTIEDIVVVLAAEKYAIIGPIPTAYNDASGNVQISYSDAAADLTLTTIDLPSAV